MASHSKVEGTMELPDIMAIAARLNGRLAGDGAPRYPAILGEIAPERFAEMGAEYWPRLRCIATRGGRGLSTRCRIISATSASFT